MAALLEGGAPPIAAGETPYDRSRPDNRPAAGALECAARRGDQPSVARNRHLRREARSRLLQRALQGNVRAVARTGEAGHADQRTDPASAGSRPEGAVAPDDYIRERVGRDIALDTTVQEFTDGRIIAYTVHPMPGGGGMATHEDITEREELNARLKKQYELGKEQEETLRVRNFQFDTAINNMSQGLCFFDSDHRLIVCNDRFVEMYDIPRRPRRPRHAADRDRRPALRSRQLPGHDARRISALAHQRRGLQRSEGQHRRTA